MNNLLIFFALPISTIILAAVFVKILKTPSSVAAGTFAIYLIVTFAVYDATFLIATIVYTALAFTSAAITKIIIKYIRNQDSENKANNESKDGIKITNILDNLDNSLNNSTNNYCRYKRI